MADRAAFDELYAKYSRSVWAVAYARRMDAELANDITQESFIRYWQQVENGNIVEHPRAWLMRVARNLAEDDAKSAFRRHGTQDPSGMRMIDQGDKSPLEQVISKEERQAVQKLLGELPEADREVLTLRYVSGMETDTIATTLETSESAVYMRLSRARQRLGELLTTQGWVKQN